MEPRTSQLVLAKLSSLLSSPSSGEEGLRQYWMPDDISVECYDCTSKFTSFRRRHHCRICGQVFCSKCCSSYIPGKYIGHTGSLRVCTFCYGFFQNYQAQDEEGERMGGLEREGARGRRTSIDEIAQLSGSLGSLASLKLGRKPSAALYTGSSVLDQTSEESSPASSIPQETVKLKDPGSLARLWERVMEPGVGLPLETHRYYLRSYPDTFQGSRLVSWLIGQDSQTTSRAQAVAIGQALLTAGYIRAVSGQQAFSDSSELYSPSQPHMVEDKDGDPVPVASHDANLMEPAWLQEFTDFPFRSEKRTSASGGRSGTGVEARKTSTEAEARRLREEQNRRGRDDIPDGLQREISVLKEAAMSEAGLDTEEAAALEAAYKTHEDRYLTVLLKAGGVDEEWRATLLRLAEAAVLTVQPDLRYGGDEDMDIRAYVKVKCVAGGEMEESRLVAGEVCSLQLAHKGMASSILQPRIALVANSIVFQREEGRFVSLDTLAMQEEEYIKNVTGRLLDSRPNVVLVERTVSRLAQEIFLREGVSLVLNVKFRVLQRLARLTQGKIISSVDSMLAPPRLGTCERFYTRKEDSARLLVFEGCKPSLGGTILLQGGDMASLACVKAVLRRLLLLKHSWRGEKSFLANEYGAMPAYMDPHDLGDDEIQLAVSPFIRVPPVEVHLAHVEEAEDMTEDGEVDRGETTLENSEIKDDISVDSGVEALDNLHPWAEAFLGCNITAPGVEDTKLQDLLSLFRAAGNRPTPFCKKLPKPAKQTKSRKVQVPCLPEDHCENLAVQFSMYSAQSCLAPNYCVLPWVVDMALYGNLDIGLGDFLDSLCFSPDYTCPNKSCNTPPLLHTRRFCHAGGAVSLHMQRLEAPIMGEESDKLMMWKYCTSCEMITNIVPVTDHTWSLSFAQFLHILLHDDKLVRRGSTRPDAVCTHSLHQGHLTCFGKQDLVVTFKYDSLKVWRLSTPPPYMTLPKPKYSRSTLQDNLTQVKDAGNNLHSKVLERLLGAKAEVVGPGLDTVCILMGDQKTERTLYRERLEALEERVRAQLWHETEGLAELRLIQRDLVLSQAAWTKKLLGVAEVRGKARTLHRTPSNEVLDLPVNVPSGKPRKEEERDTTTVKKLITSGLSTILPHNEENTELPGILPADTHLVTHSGGEPVSADIPPFFVTEGKPSSLIAYLLSSPSYQTYLDSRKDASETDPHFVLEFSDDSAKFYCCSYFTAEFHQLRQMIFPGGGANFVSSLENCRRWEAMGGKSGLLFYKTTDDRFVLKQMSRFEYQSFLEFAPHYFEYLGQCVQNDEKTLLGKIVGVFKIGFKNSSTGLGMNMEFLIMENLFYGKEVIKSYDLKGSVRNRLMAEEDGQTDGQVLLDENLVRISCESPLYIGQTDKEALNEAVRRDTAFLASHQMMDYSLLAGMMNDNELVVGIIDYIRTFTWDKKLETLVKSVKSSGVFGGQAKTPTVINPDLYKQRFTDAMNRYFSSVPD